MALEYITSKNLFVLICDTLSLIDKRLVEHGKRVGYILMEMLKTKGGYEKFEMADYLLLTIMHDIGAYKTDEITPELAYDVKEYMPHSIYGYLFIKNLSPQMDFSKIILYHHTSVKDRKKSSYEFMEIADYLAAAEIIDVFGIRYGKELKCNMLEKYIGKKFSKEAYDLLEKTVADEHIFERILTGEYQQDIEELLEYVLFSDFEKEKYLKLLIFISGLREENSVSDTVATICIAKEIANYLKLNELEQNDIFYGALLHDLGMLSVPIEILHQKKELTEEEKRIIRKHVERTKQLVEGKFNEEIVKIACSHHERLDGSGYPSNKKENAMNIKEEILQVADTVVGMTNFRCYRPIKTKEEVINILLDESNEERLNEEVVDCFITNYDKIMEKVKMKSEISLQMHKKLATEYDRIYEKLVN